MNKEMSVPQNVRTQFDTSAINTGINAVEEIDKESYYADAPYIPAQDPRCLNVVAKCNESVEVPAIKDDFIKEDTFEKLMRTEEIEVAVKNILKDIEKNQALVVEVQSALQAGGDVVIAESITVTGTSEADRNIITKDTVVDFGNSVITLDIPDATSTTENWVGLTVNGGNVVLNAENGGVKTANNPELYAVVVRNGADLTINGGNYVGGSTAVQSIEGIVNIAGGFFKVQEADQRYTLNCIDSAYKAGKASFVVTGGTFVNFDPSNSMAESEAPVSFVAEGYKVVAEAQSNGDIWYTVVAE